MVVKWVIKEDADKFDLEWWKYGIPLLNLIYAIIYLIVLIIFLKTDANILLLAFVVWSVMLILAVNAVFVIVYIVLDLMLHKKNYSMARLRIIKLFVIIICSIVIFGNLTLDLLNAW